MYIKILTDTTVYVDSATYTLWDPHYATVFVDSDTYTQWDPNNATACVNSEIPTCDEACVDSNIYTEILTYATVCVDSGINKLRLWPMQQFVWILAHTHIVLANAIACILRWQLTVRSEGREQKALNKGNNDS